jgi:hypothetical protein
MTNKDHAGHRSTRVGGTDPERADRL